MRIYALVIICATTLLLAAFDRAMASSLTIVSPAGLAETEGNGRLVLPAFDILREHNLYPAADFASLPASHRWLSGFALRTDESTGFAYTATSAHLEIRLSTTPIDSLSATFADNVGPDQALVYSGPFTAIETASAPPGGPRPFQQLLAFDTPFFYDWAAGNLLVEFRYVGFVRNPPVDVFNDVEFYGDGVNRLIASWTNQVTADFVSDGMNVFQFEFVPEPSTFALTGIGALALFADGVRRRFVA